MDVVRVLNTFPDRSSISVLTKSGAIISGVAEFAAGGLMFDIANVNAQGENHYTGLLALSLEAIEAVWLERPK